MNQSKKTFLILIIAIIFTFASIVVVSAKTTSTAELFSYDFHHIFPQNFFNSIGDGSTAKLRYFEHKFIHSGKGAGLGGVYNNDWQEVENDVPLLTRIFKGGETELHSNGNIKIYSKRKAAIIAGSRLITYRLAAYEYKSKKVNIPYFLFAMHLDGYSNLLYNISYISSIPSKFIHFSLECLKRVTGIFNRGNDTYSLIDGLKIYVWMVFQLLFGFFSASIMIIVGPIIGIIFHPLETLGNITFSLSDPFMSNVIWSIIDLVVAVIKPLLNIIFWSL